jgi:hypothetical protein
MAPDPSTVHEEYLGDGVVGSMNGVLGRTSQLRLGPDWVGVGTFVLV